jgi:hypothetical protein
MRDHRVEAVLKKQTSYKYFSVLHQKAGHHWLVAHRKAD